MLYIGDVHGLWADYYKIIENHSASVQIGDFGIGFPTKTQQDYADLEKAISHGNHKMIAGNHDNPEVWKTHPFCLASGTVEDGRMYINGARSIDQLQRTEGYDWWPEEEHSYEQLSDLINLYEQVKPDVMVTHDGPKTVAAYIHQRHQSDSQKSRSSQAFETMFEIWKPSVWIYGHWHESRRMNILGTEFICLNQLETLEI